MKAHWWPLSAVPQPVVEDWRALATRALEPNPFAEPELVLAAARHLGDRRQPHLLAVSDARGMRACLAVVRTPTWRRIPLPTVASWRHDYCFLGTPLVDPERAEPALAELLEAATGGRRVLALEWLHADGPVAAAVHRAAASTGTSIACYERFTRAAVGARPTGPTRLKLSGDHRRRLGRLLRQLGRADGADVRIVQHSGERALVEQFLVLEAAGWKGAAGTAMSTRPGHAEFLVDVCDAFDVAGRLRLDALEVGGRAAAVMCSFQAGSGLFLFKIAHDPALARYSLGTQVVADVVQTSAPAWVDSGAAPDESWLNDLLPERRTLTTLVVTPPGRLGRVITSATRSFVNARDARVRRRYR